jgi:hypothetical protein
MQHGDKVYIMLPESTTNWHPEMARRIGDIGEIDSFFIHWKKSAADKLVVVAFPDGAKLGFPPDAVKVVH